MRKRAWLSPVAVVGLLSAAFSSPVEASTLYSQAMARYRAGDYEGAIAGLSEYVAREPGDASAPYALYLLGDTYLALERVPDGIAALGRAVERYPASEWATSAAYRIAAVRSEREEWEEAAEALIRFVDLYLRNRGDTVGGWVVSQAMERIISCEQRVHPERSRVEIERDLLRRFPGHPVAEAIIFASGPAVLPPGSNLLRNPGFELDRGSMMLPPLGWQYRGTEPNPDDDADGTLDEPVLGGLPLPRSGRFCLGKFTSYGVHQGWVFQTVPVTPGRRYACSVFGMVVGTEHQTGTLRVGVDPDGGSDPEASRVRWTDYASPYGAYAALGFVGEQAIEAGKGTLTLFLEFRQPEPRPDNVMLFDDAEVKAID